MRKKILCSALVLTFGISSAYAVDSNSIQHFNAKNFELASLKTDLEIEKVKLEEQKIKSQMSSLSSQNDPKTKDSHILKSIKLEDITIIGNHKIAEIEINGSTNSYKEGDLLNNDLTIKQINSNSIILTNFKTNKEGTLRVSR